VHLLAWRGGAHPSVGRALEAGGALSIPIAVLVPGLLLVVASLFDLKTREIPDAIPVLLVLWAVASRALGFQEARWVQMTIGLALGLGIGLLAFRYRALGGGDAKLLAGLGACTGPVLLGFVLAWTGLVGGMLALVARLRRRRRVVYGPAIALGYVLGVWHTWLLVR